MAEVKLPGGQKAFACDCCGGIMLNKERDGFYSFGRTFLREHLDKYDRCRCCNRVVCEECKETEYSKSGLRFYRPPHGDSYDAEFNIYCKNCWGIGEPYRAARDEQIRIATSQGPAWHKAAKAIAESAGYAQKLE